MNDTKSFYRADDVAELLEVSRPTAYRIIKQLNEQLEKAGFIVVAGRVPVRFFNERFYSGGEHSV